MKSLNKVILIGGLGADPEVRSTQNGGRVATLSLATSRQWKGSDGQKQEKTEWHRVICWNNPKGGKLADIVESYSKKGDRLYVEGEVSYRSWQDKDGQTKYATEIVAKDIIFLNMKDDAAPARKAEKKLDLGEVPEALDDEDDDLPF